MSENRTDWPAVGAAVTARRKALGMGQAGLARASGVSDATVRRIERGEGGDVRDELRSRVATALSWPPDALERIARGSDPTVNQLDDATELRSLVADLVAQVRVLAAGHEKLGAEVARLRRQTRRGDDESPGGQP